MEFQKTIERITKLHQKALEHGFESKDLEWEISKDVFLCLYDTIAFYTDSISTVMELWGCKASVNFDTTDKIKLIIREDE